MSFLVVSGSLPNILGGMKGIGKTRTLELEEAIASQLNPMKDKSQKAFEEQRTIKTGCDWITSRLWPHPFLILLTELKWHQANTFNWKIWLREKYLKGMTLPLV